MDIREILKKRIVILDGAMGTMIQALGLVEEDYRGKEFRDHPKDLRLNNDVLNIAQPQIIESIHRQYLEAGADIIETNTFNSNAISMAEYGLQDRIYDLNKAGAQVARRAVEHFTKENPGSPRFVAGSLGPTSRTASMSQDVNSPASRAATFDQLRAAYQEQARGLLDGGVDLLLVETIFDTLNAKAALFAIDQHFEETGRRVPVMASVTITDQSGRTLSGQTVEAFWISVSHMNLLSVGINCALGAKQMRPYIEELSRVAPIYISCYPNAGLPNAFGGFDETPESMATDLQDFAANGWLNIVGGCCGTTPAHIRAIADAVKDLKPHTLSKPARYTRFSGLEPLVIRPDTNFVNIGERTNVTGSPKFSKLILNGKLEEALAIARQQVEGGAQIIDINMDEAMLDSEQAMTTFLHYIASEPEISPRSDHDRQLEVERDRSRPEVHSGKRNRQFRKLEGGRRGFQATHPADSSLWRGHGHHGVRREGPSRHRGAQARNLHALVQNCHRGSGHTAGRYYFRSQYPDYCDRNGRTQQLCCRFH